MKGVAVSAMRRFEGKRVSISAAGVATVDRLKL